MKLQIRLIETDSLDEDNIERPKTLFEATNSIITLLVATKILKIWTPTQKITLTNMQC